MTETHQDDPNTNDEAGAAGAAPSEEQGEKLLSAVERIVDDPENLIAQVAEFERKTRREPDGSDKEWRRAVADEIVSHYSTWSAVSGGATALPATVPGIGTLVATVGGTLADMCMTLKFEVEMALCLTHLYGWDIRDERERQLAYLLASVSTVDAKSGGNFLADLAKVEWEAIWKYAPRQISKFLLQAMTKLAVISASKSLVRALPLIGIGVSAGVNKVLTTRVGGRCADELARRRTLQADTVEAEVVDANFKG